MRSLGRRQIGCLVLGCLVVVHADDSCSDRRPPLADRTFHSAVVEDGIEQIAKSMKDQTLACIFRNAFPNCLDTTIYSFQQASTRGSMNETGSVGGYCGRWPQTCGPSRETVVDEDDTFVVTGDISAMWLRDSMNQVLPYMRFAEKDARLKALLRGVLRRQTRQVHVDVYANAHNQDRFGNPGSHVDDHTTKPSYLGTTVTAMTSYIFERKYELDTLCAFLKLGAEYFAATSDAQPFDDKWVQAVRIVLSTMRSQQSSTAADSGIYNFQRCSSCEPTDTLSHGIGFPAERTGMIRSAFRPSDDATQYQFLVPANAMAVVELRRTAAILHDLKVEDSLAKELTTLSNEVDEALRREAVVSHKRTREDVFAYEVDGFDNVFHMDDANVPSLLSLPYLGYISSNDSVYKSTRQVVLNTATNPYFFHGDAGEGVGSPHTGRDNIWPMGIIMRALTSTDDNEILHCLEMLKTTTASAWFMHESFEKDNPTTYSRPWFSWANSLFGELIFRLADSRPHLIYNVQTLDSFFVS